MATAFQSGSFTNLTDALAIWTAWLVTNGWTLDGSSDASRTHVSKQMHGVVHYFNFQAVPSGNPFGDSGYGDLAVAIAVNGSTGFNGGSLPMNQPGCTKDARGASDSSGGCVDEIKVAGGLYWAFATDTSATIVYETDSLEGDYRMMTVGSAEGRSFYAASGGRLVGTSTIYDRRSAYLGSNDSSTSVSWTCIAGLLVDGQWHCTSRLAGLSWPYSIGTQANYYATASIANIKGSYASKLLMESPTPFSGNSPIAPCVVVTAMADDDEMFVAGSIEGVYWINMTNYANLEEITIGSSVYKLYKPYAKSEYGLALLKAS